MNRPTAEQLWELTELVSEKFNTVGLVLWGNKVFGTEFILNVFKSSKGDEVCQWVKYDNSEGFTWVGGSSGDGKEWRGNFNLFRGKKLFKKKERLREGFVHNGFWLGADAVLNSKHFRSCKRMTFGGYSRGASIATELCRRTGKLTSGIVIAPSRIYKKHVNLPFLVYHKNKLDIVSWLVPGFKHAGNAVLYKFWKRPHTGFCPHLKGK